MGNLKVYVVSSYRIEDYETIGEETSVFRFESNAHKRLQDIKNQDFMPIVEKDGFEVHCDNSTHFEAGYEGDYSRGSVCVKITETFVEDYVLSD